MKNIDFTQKVYTLDSKNMVIICRTLAEVVRESEKDDGSKLHIEEANGMWELRYRNFRGHDTLVETFPTEAEAEQDMLTRIYEYDYLTDAWSCNWSDSVDEAIDDYIDLRSGEGEEITKEMVLSQIEATQKDIEDTKKRLATNLAVDMKKAYEQFQKDGQPSKKTIKTARDIKFGCLHYNGSWNILIQHSEIVPAETLAQANEILSFRN